MKKVIILCLFALNSFAQTTLPSSGPITLHQIATVMVNLGELSSIYLQPNTPYTIAYLNSVSHLADKNPPYTLSDWYSYTSAINSATGTQYVVNQQNPNPPHDQACASSIPATVYYTGTLGVGTVLYTNSNLTNPAIPGSWQFGGTWYWINGSGGQITETGFCNFN